MFQASTVLFNEKQFGISPFLLACSELGIDPGRAASMFNKPYTLEVPMEHQTNASSGRTIPMTPSFFPFDVQPSVDKPPDVMNPQDHDNLEDHHLEPSSSSSDPSSLPSSSGPSSHDESSLGKKLILVRTTTPYQSHHQDPLLKSLQTLLSLLRNRHLNPLLNHPREPTWII